MLAGALGVIIVFAPAGAGIRELVLVFGLASVMDTGAALLVALMSRLISVVADVGLAAVAALMTTSPPALADKARDSS